MSGGFQVNTWAGDMITTPGQSTQSTDITGTNIVSVGIQTNNNQESFVPTQLFVSNDGTQAYIQVTNNQFGNIGWWPWVVFLTDSSTGSVQKKPDFQVKIGTAKKIERS